MRCRRNKNYNNTNHTVMFGSWGDLSLKRDDTIVTTALTTVVDATIGLKINLTAEIIYAGTAPSITPTITVHDGSQRTIRMNVYKDTNKYILTCTFASRINGDINITFNYYIADDTTTVISIPGQMKYMDEETELIDLVLDPNTQESARVAALSKLKADYNINVSLDNYRTVLNHGLTSTINSYSSDKNAVVDSLTQRLSIIKGELWYQINYGLPLLDKVKSKAIYDSVIINIITSHPGVKEIISYTSKVVKNVYTFECNINTIYNSNITINSNYSL